MDGRPFVRTKDRTRPTGRLVLHSPLTRGSRWDVVVESREGAGVGRGRGDAVGDDGQTGVGGDFEGVVVEVEIADIGVVEVLPAAAVILDVVGVPAKGELLAVGGEFVDEVGEAGEVGEVGEVGEAGVGRGAGGFGAEAADGVVLDTGPDRFQLPPQPGQAAQRPGVPAPPSPQDLPRQRQQDPAGMPGGAGRSVSGVRARAQCRGFVEFEIRSVLSLSSEQVPLGT